VFKAQSCPSHNVMIFLEHGSLPYSQQPINTEPYLATNKSIPQPYILFTEDSFHYNPTNEGLPRELFPSHFCTKLSHAGTFSTMRATCICTSSKFYTVILKPARHCSTRINPAILLRLSGNRSCTNMKVYQQMAAWCTDNTLCVAITTNTR